MKSSTDIIAATAYETLMRRPLNYTAAGVAADIVAALAAEGFAIVPAVPTPEMVAVCVQCVGDPSPEAWAIAEQVCAVLGGPRVDGETACATLVRDWQNMVEQARAGQ